MDAGTVTFYKNGISQGVAYSGLSGYFSPSIGDGGQSTAASGSANFGQKPFKFPPPAGFQPLALANTPRPTIVRPDQYVGIVTYTGTGATRSLNVGFKPDFVWIKERGATGGPVIVDSVRGSSATLQTHATTQEQIDGDAVTGFNPYGLSLGSGYTVVSVNGSTRTYVGWAWKAGGNSNTYNINDIGYSTASAAGLTAGTKTPTGASVNTKSGFSIIAFTGDETAGTISHGLGKAPSFYIVKTRDSNSGGSNDWYCYHSALGASARIQLNSTDAQTTGSSQWNSTSPTSSVLSLGSGSWQETGDRFIIYAWAEIPGFSKFGSYTGNYNADGPFVHTGFRPRWVMIKCSSTSGFDWRIFDTSRSDANGANPVNYKLYPNLNARENDPSYDNASSNNIDILSSGFKLRTNNGATNDPNTYIYAAFAETPSFNLYGGQSNAR